MGAERRIPGRPQQRCQTSRNSLDWLEQPIMQPSPEPTHNSSWLGPSPMWSLPQALSMWCYVRMRALDKRNFVVETSYEGLKPSTLILMLSSLGFSSQDAFLCSFIRETVFKCFPWASSQSSQCLPQCPYLCLNPLICHRRSCPLMGAIGDAPAPSSFP